MKCFRADWFQYRSCIKINVLACIHLPCSRFAVSKSTAAIIRKSFESTIVSLYPSTTNSSKKTNTSLEKDLHFCGLPICSQTYRAQYGMAQATKKFADYFWDDKDAGFATLMERMKAAKHTCVELADLFKARSVSSFGEEKLDALNFEFRADMEEDFGKRLMKMSKSTALGKDETGFA